MIGHTLLHGSVQRHSDGDSLQATQYQQTAHWRRHVAMDDWTSHDLHRCDWPQAADESEAGELGQGRRRRHWKLGQVGVRLLETWSVSETDRWVDDGDQVAGVEGLWDNCRPTWRHSADQSQLGRRRTSQHAAVEYHLQLEALDNWHCGLDHCLNSARHRLGPAVKTLVKDGLKSKGLSHPLNKTPDHDDDCVCRVKNSLDTSPVKNSSELHHNWNSSCDSSDTAAAAADKDVFSHHLFAARHT